MKKILLGVLVMCATLAHAQSVSPEPFSYQSVFSCRDTVVKLPKDTGGWAGYAQIDLSAQAGTAYVYLHKILLNSKGTRERFWSVAVPKNGAADGSLLSQEVDASGRMKSLPQVVPLNSGATEAVFLKIMDLTCP